VDGAFNNPKPIRGDIPILIGGSGERKTLRFVAKYADGSNLFGDVERVKHLLGVLEGHCEDVGRDPAEITKTRMATVYIAPTQEAAEAKFKAVAGDSAQARAQAFVGEPSEIARQTQAYLDAGLDGITIVMPDVHDIESVKLAGEALGAVIRRA
jgi:alkanesulfonate monooxygenase SsuD/methylene tetrahydromethanopterin reductase-like flavin-dependent oxidoreductase (luciferase family)